MLNQTLADLLKDLGPIPGKYLATDESSIFSIFLTSQLKKKIRGSWKSNGSSCENVTSPTTCDRFEQYGLTFVKRIKTLYPLGDSSVDFLSQRPDFYLGRFLLLFLDQVRNMFVTLDDFLKVHFNLTKTKTVGNRNPSCNNLLNDLLQINPDQFLEVVKFSEFSFWQLTETDKKQFMDKYVAASIFARSLNMTEPKYLSDSPRSYLPFCDVVPLNTLPNKFRKSPYKCDYFKPLMTSKGICQSFNVMAMNDIFRSSTSTGKWTGIFNAPEKTGPLLRPTGYGSNHGLNLVVNAFEATKLRSSKNFVLAITNENNPFQILKHNYLLKPGFSYTFRILASQVTTTARFDSMDFSVRGCALPDEISSSSIFKKYSRDNCEYECAIAKARESSHCLPWSIPRLVNDSIRFCNSSESAAFQETLFSVASSDCSDCPSDCQATTFTVFETKVPLDVSSINCHQFNSPTTEYGHPEHVLCSECKKMIKGSRIRLLYDAVIFDDIYPGT